MSHGLLGSDGKQLSLGLLTTVPVLSSLSSQSEVRAVWERGPGLAVTAGQP